MNEEHFKIVTQSLMDFCRDKLGYEDDPDVRYVRDEENARNMLASTANYNPSSKVVTVYISKRHPKDILRSVAHELVHHDQCCRGDLDNSHHTPPGYAQKDPHMRNMEKEAYLKGNMMFRDWEDSEKESGDLVTLRFIGENNMKDLEDYIENEVNLVLEGKKKKPDDDGDGVPDWADKKPGKDDHEDSDKKEKVEEDSDNIAEAKCPHCDGDAPKSECNCNKNESTDLQDLIRQAVLEALAESDIMLSEGSMKKTSRFKEGQKVTHKTDNLGVGTVVSRSGTTVGVMWKSGQQSHDHNMLKQSSMKEGHEDPLSYYKDMEEEEKEPYDYDDDGSDDLSYKLRAKLRAQKEKGKKKKDLEEAKPEKLTPGPDYVPPSYDELPSKQKPNKAREKRGEKGKGHSRGSKDRNFRQHVDVQRGGDGARKNIGHDTPWEKNESRSELTVRKAEQSSINRLNEQRLINLNKMLIEKLLK